MNQLWKETFYGRKKRGKAMRRYTQTNKPNCNLKIRWAKDEHMGVNVYEYNISWKLNAKIYEQGIHYIWGPFKFKHL